MRSGHLGHLSVKLLGLAMGCALLLVIGFSACQTTPPPTRQQLLAQAHENLDKGNFHKALSELSQVLTQDPNNLEVHENIGWIYLYTKQSEKASAEIQRIESLDPHYKHLPYMKGYLYAQLEQWVEALEQYNEALKTDQAQDPGLHGNIAQAFLAVNEPDAALKEFENALKLQPQNGDYEFGQCMAYRQLTQYDQAVAMCQQAYGHTQNMEQQEHIQTVLETLKLLKGLGSTNSASSPEGKQPDTKDYTPEAGEP